MQEASRDQQEDLRTDAVVIGGGLAGLSAAIHLVRSGLSVICLEPRRTFHQIVGESLDWSAPDLLAQLGLPMNELVASGAATYKRHILVEQLDGSQETYLPGEWLGRRPWNIELRTMHLDRLRIQDALQDSAHALGVVRLQEKAAAIVSRNRRISAVETSAGRCIRATWFIDASGSAASVLGREFQLRSTSYGPRKVAIWGHAPTENWVEGTRLYMLSPVGEYMEWLWEIPIHPGLSSIGYVAPGAKVKAQRAHGQTNTEIFTSQLKTFNRFDEMVSKGQPEHLAATSFLCRTFKTVCGENWIIIGEAASQSDPITGNGVTAALRHAAEASALVCRYRTRGKIPVLARAAYNLRVLEMGRFFNSLIEKIVYEPALRAKIGIFWSGRIYTVPAWLGNLLYSRIRPKRLLGTAAFCSGLACLRLIAWACFGVSRLLGKRQTKPVSAAAAGRERRVLHLAR